MVNVSGSNLPVPCLVACLRHYSWHTFALDALAGVTVGFVALPLAMAFAIASGLTRIRILEILAKGEARVQDLQQVLTLEQLIVSQQLARLRSAGIVSSRKEGATIYYSVADRELGESPPSSEAHFEPSSRRRAVVTSGIGE